MRFRRMLEGVAVRGGLATVSGGSAVEISMIILAFWDPS